MNAKKNKAELMAELQAAQKRIAELEVAVANKRKTRTHAASPEQGLADGESLFKRVFLANPSWMALTDASSGKYVEVNEVFLQTLGVKREEVLGKTTAELNVFVNPDQLASIVERGGSQGYIRDENIRVRTKAGEIRNGILAGNFIHKQDHRFLLTVMHDVTERKLAEESLQKSESQYRALLANAKDMIMVIDKEGRFTYVSPASENAMGYKPEELLGKDFRERIHPDDLTAVNQSFSHRSQNPGTAARTLKVRVLHKDGIWRTTEALGTNMFNDPSICGIVLNVHEVTEQERANDALKKNEALLAEAQRIGHIGHWEWALPGADVVCSDELLNILGIQHHSNLIPRAMITAMVDEQDRENLMLRYSEVIANRADLNYEFRIHRADGSMRWIHQMAQVTYSEDGKPLRMLGTMQDITEQKQLLEQMMDLAKFPAENPGPILRIDLNGKLEYANNSAFALLTEWPLELGKTVPSALLDIASLVLESELDKTVEVVHESRIITLDFVLLRQGGYINIYGRDITEQRRAEEKLRESEIRAHAMLDAIPDLMFRMDRQGVFLDYKADIQDLYAQNIPTIVGLRNRDIAPAEFADLIEQKIQETLDTESVQTFEYQLSIPNRGMHDYEARMARSGTDEVVTVVRDITHRKTMEREINQVNQRFTELAENLSDIFWVSEPGTRKNLYVSPAFATVMGMSVEDAEQLPNRYLDLVLSEDWHILTRIRELEDSGFKTDTKYRIRRPDGSIRWIHDKGTPVFDANGKVVRVVGMASDITDQVEAERRVSDSENRFRQIAEAIPEIFWMVDNDKKRMSYVSPAYETIMGRPMQELEEDDNTYMDAIPLEDQAAMYEAFERQDQGEPTEMEYRVVRPDGTIRWIHDRSFPIFDEETGKLIRTVGIATDITERRFADQALRDSEERLRLSLAASHQGLYDLNIQTGDAIINREYAEMLGYDPDTFVETNQESLERTHPDDKEIVSKAFTDYIKGITPEYHVEFRQKTKDGRWKWILSMGKAVEFDVNGKPLRLLGTHTDIDALKQAEIELQKRAAQLALINDVGKEIAGVLDIQGVLDLSAHLVHESFGYHHIGLFTMNEEKDGMVMRSRAGKYAHLFPDNHYIKLGDGIVGTVGIRGEMVLTNQVAGDSTYKNFFPEVLNTVSELGLPMKIAGQVIGVLDVQSPVPDAFNENDIQVLQTLADQVAIALENARLYESLQKELTERRQAEQERQVLIHDLGKRTEDLTHLVEAGHALSETLDPKRIYPLIYRYISNAMPCDFVIISSYDPKTNLIRCEHLHSNKGAQDVSALPPILLEPPGLGTQSLVIRSGESLLLSDYESALKTAANIIQFNEKAEIIEEVSDVEDHTRSAIIVPLKVNGMVTGVLQVLSSELNAHTQDHLRFTEALAFHVSAALSNAQLFSELEERVHQRTVEVQDLYDNAPAGYHSLDAGGRFMLINQTELNWLGYTHEEVIGRHISSFLTSKSLMTFQETFPIFKYSGTLNNLELEMRRKDGSTFPVLVNATAVKDHEGNYLMSRSMVIDNSERRKAELALREGEEQNRLLFEESPEAVILFDQTGRVLRMNRAFETITGVNSEKFTGHLISEIGLAPQDLMNSIILTTVEGFEKNGRVAEFEFKLKHVNGELRDISTRIFTLNLQGRLHYLTSMHDITTNKRAEETLRIANVEMERALRLKDEFLANMSHELRTPLNAVLGITESLLEQGVATLSEKQQKYLQTVLESAQHLLELINDILDLAKINAGRIELDINKVDVHSAARASLRMIRELAQKKGLNVELNIDEDVKTVSADERRLKQMLVNLLSNAVKFTPHGGHIGLVIYGDKSRQVLDFIVWDTGIGISQQDLHLLFRPFVQLDAGLSRGNQGTGLGLVLVSQMARLHGGSVSVESEPQKGSRFTISIPWAEEGQADRSAPPVEAPKLAPPIDHPIADRKDGARILIVEDTEAVIMLLSDYLKAHGFEVITARNGFDGITRAKEIRPDLILMDVMMPEMDGFETTHRIREDLGMKNVPIIALTALAMAGDRERCLAAGMNDYMSKPVQLKELLTCIQNNLKPDKGDSQ